MTVMTVTATVSNNNSKDVIDESNNIDSDSYSGEFSDDNDNDDSNLM